jgi:hypothetical protein
VDDLVEISGYLIEESSVEWTINLYAPNEKEVYYVHLPKDRVQVEFETFVARVPWITFTLPEWLAINLEISAYCHRQERIEG